MLRALSVWVIVSHVFGLVPAVFAGPEAGTVVGGQATIDSAAGITNIRQSTDRAIINWGSFSSSASEHINFQQPGANSATVNRVTGGGHSQLDGSLTAPGHVFILNPNGVVFGKSSKVNVGGLTASTLDMDNDTFMSGSKKLTLRQVPGKPQGAVVNKGSIVAGRGGVTLVAPVVNNEGSIRATNGGNVNIGAGTEADLEIGETGLMTMKVRGDAGGDVHMPDGASSDVLETVVNNKAFVDAGTVTKVNGEVILGGAGGIALNEGTIASEGAAGVKAGTVKMDSTALTVLAPGSKISANGQGLESDGGRVEIFSRGHTVFAPYAQIEARGGDTGNGGFVETSADKNIWVEGDVDTTATAGEGGRWVIDPSEITIIDAASGSGTQDGGSFATGPGGLSNATGILSSVGNQTPNTVSDSRINAQMVGAGQTDVFIEATGHINFSSGVAIDLANNHNIFFHVTNTTSDVSSAQIFGPANGLAQISNLNATDTGKVFFLVDAGTNAGKVDLSNMAIDGAAGGVFIVAPGNVTVDKISSNGSSGMVNIQTGGRIDRTTVIGNAQNIAGTQVLLKANGIGSANTPVVVSTPQLVVDQSAGGDVFLNSPQTSTTVANVGGSGSFSLSTGNNTNIVVGNNLTIANTTFATFENRTVNGASNITGLTANSGTIKLNSAGNITTQGAATLTGVTGDLTAVTGINSVNTQQLTNLSAKNTGVGATGDINLINGRAVTFDANNTASIGNVVFRNTTGGITIGANNVAAVNDITVTADTGNMVLTGTTTAGAAKTITYTATAGAINGLGLLTAGTVLLTAPNGVGNLAGQQVRTSAPNVAILATSGDISMASQGVNVKVGAQSNTGLVHVQASGGLLESATVNGIVGVSSAGAGKSVSLVNTAGGDVKVTSAVSANAGDIVIVSAQGVQLANNVTTGSNTARFIDVIAQNGTITRTAGTLTAGTIGLDATLGIGASNQRVQTSTQNLVLGGLSVGGTLVVNGGDDFITNTGAALALAGVSSGNIDVINSANDLVVSTLTAGALAAPPLPSAVTAAAQNGLTANGGKNIALTTVTSGNVAINNAVTASAGGIGIIAAGNIVLAADVTTGLNNNGKIVDLIAQAGSMTRTAGTVTSGNVALSAANGIGANGQRVQLSASNLQLGGLLVNGTAQTNAGNDFVENGGAVNLTVAGGSTTGSVDVVQNNANVTTATHAAGAFNFAPNAITSAQRVGVAVAGAGSKVALETLGAGDVIVTDAISTAGGDIGLVSIANIALGASVTTGSSTGASIADLIARGGAITRSGGVITAGNVGFAATAGLGAATARVETATSNLQVGGFSVGGSAVTHGGNSFVNNTAVDLTYSALNANGNIDLTQTSANLTIGTFAAGAFNFTAPGGSPALDVTSAAQAGVTAQGNGKTISLVTVTSGSINVNADVLSKNGDIGIVSQQNLALAANVATDNVPGTATNTRLIDLIARTGAITRTAGTVTSGNVAMTATGGIGAATAANRVQTSTSNLQIGGLSVNGTQILNGGADFIDNTGNVALTVAAINNTQNVEITNTGANMTVGALNIGGFSPASPNSAANVTSGGRTGIALIGASRPLTLLTKTSGNIVVNQAVTTAGGNMAIVAADSVALAANVSTASSTGGSLVDIAALNGTITRTAGTVTAGNVAVTATQGIGAATAGNRLQTATSNLQIGGLTVNGTARTNGGADFIENVGGNALTFAGNNADNNIDLTNTGADLTVGTLTLGAFDPVNPNSAVVVSGATQTGLTAATAGKTISLVTQTSGSIRVNNQVSTNLGDIGLVAADSIALADNVTVGSTSVNLVDLIARAGTITRTAGTVTAGNVVAAATLGIGSPVANARLQTSTSNLQLGGVSVNGTAVTNGGDQFVENVGNVAANLAAINANGVVDVTQTGADLTITTLALGAFDPASPSAARVTSTAPVVGVTGQGLTKSISLVTLGAAANIAVLGNGPITSNAGDIALVSSTGISLAGDITTGANTGSTLVDLIAMAGSITHTAGTVTAGNVAMAATGDIGAPTTNNRVKTSTSNLQIGGLSVTPRGGALTAVNNAGNDFVENVGNLALTVAAVNSAGKVDVTNTGGNLTVNQLQLGAFDPQAPNSAAKVTSASQNGINLAGNGASVSLVTQTAGDIVVTRNINTTNGNVGLVSAKSIVIGNNVSTSSATAGGAQVNLIARDGSITRSNAQIANPRITAPTVVAAATLGIGAAAAGSRLQTSTSNLQVGGVTVNGTAVTNAGNDFFENLGSVALRLSAVNANGNFDLTQTGADVTVSTQQSATFSPEGANSAATVATPATVIGINTANTANKTVALTTLTAGNVVVAADGPITTNAGDIGVVSVNGISLAADVTTGSATNAALVDLIARGGAITRTAGTVIAGNVAVASNTSIGTATQRLITSTSNLQIGDLTVNLGGVTNSGDDFIENTGGIALTVAGVNANGNIDLVQNNANLTVGTLAIGNFDPAAPNSAAKVTSTSRAGLQTLTVDKTISLVTAGSGDILLNNRIDTVSGDVALISAKNVALANDINTTATGALVDVIAQDGAITRSAGTITSENTVLAATQNIGTATARVRTSTSHLKLGDVAVNGVDVINGGSDFIENVGGVNVQVAGFANAGSIDITQTSGNLTIGSEAIGAFNPANPNSFRVVTATNRDGLVLGGADQTISLVTQTSGDIVVNQAIDAGTRGDAALVSVNNVVLNSNVTAPDLVDVVARGGSITRTAGTITSDNVALAATLGIGAANARVVTATTNLQLGGLSVNGTAVTNGGNDFVANTTGLALTLAAINANGNIDVTNDGANMTTSTLQKGAFDPANPNSAAVVSAPGTVVGVNAQGAGKTVSLATLNSGDVIVNGDGAVVANAGDIALVAADGIQLNGDVTNGSAANAKLVDLIARNGAITRTAGTVQSGNVAVAATNGIGAATSGNRLRTSTSNLQIGGLTVNGTAVVNGGNDFIENTGGVATTVAGVNASGNIDVTNTSANLTVGQLTLGAFDPANPDSAIVVTSAQQTGLTAQNAGSTISLVTLVQGNLVVNNDVTSNAGDIGLIAATGVALGANVTTGSNASGALVDVFARNGSITRTAGTVTSSNVVMGATAGIGAANARVATDATNLQVGGVNVNGTAFVNGGDDFLANSGTALTFAAVNASGNVDLIQTGSDLTVGLLNLGTFFPAGADSAATVAGAARNGVLTQAAGKSISLVTATAGDIIVAADVINNAGTTALVSAANVRLGDDVTTGSAGAGTVDAIARNGSITRTAGTVTAGATALAATAGIGAANARVQTSTSNLQLGGLSVNGTAVANGGGDFVANVGGVAVNVAGVNTNSVIDLIQNGADLTITTLNVGAFAPAAVTSVAQTGLTAQGAGQTIAVRTVGSGSIVVDDPVTTNGGNIGLLGATSLRLADDVNTGATTGASTVDLIAQGGSITRTGGTVFAGGLAATAAGGIGASGARIVTNTSALRLGGLFVDGTAQLSSGDTFFANGGTALTVAGTVNGGIDVTQTGAALTVGSLAIGTFAPQAVTAGSVSGLTSTLAGGTIALQTVGAGDVNFGAVATATNVRVNSAANLVNLLGGANNITASDANLIAAASLGSGASFFGVTAATLTASSPNASQFINSFGNVNTLFTANAKTDITLNQLGGDLLLNTLVTEQAITLDARTGSILDGSGGAATNLTTTGGARSTLTAAVSVGQRGVPITVNLDSGSLGVAAGGTDGLGASANINGRIVPEFTIRPLGTFAGDVIFNGRVLTGTVSQSQSELDTQRANPAQTPTIDNEIAAAVSTTLAPSAFQATTSSIITADPFQQDDFIEEDPAAAPLARSGRQEQGSAGRGELMETTEAMERAAATDASESETTEPTGIDAQALGRTLKEEVDAAKDESTSSGENEEEENKKKGQEAQDEGQTE